MAGLPRDIKTSTYNIQRDHYRIVKQCITAALVLFISCFVIEFKAFSEIRVKNFAYRLSQAPADAIVSAVIYVKGTVDPGRYFGHRANVLRHIAQQTKNYQKNLVAFLQKEQSIGGITRFRSFWIINAILVEGKADILRQINRRADVNFLKENYTLALPETKQVLPSPVSQKNEWGITAIRADRVWEAYGFKGKNIRIGHLDTGVEAEHPDLLGKISRWARIDPFGSVIEDNQVFDSGSHGTHTAGILVGGDAGGTAIGVAPEAQLYSAMVVNGGIGTFAQVISGIQWIINPDENPDTDDGVDVLNLSLGMTGASDDFIEPVNNLIAADIFPSFSIGNSGPNSSTSPGNIPESFAVGAIDNDNNVAYFSSGDTVSWNIPPYVGTWTKPDIVAPGVNVKSSVPGGYSWYSGTSMSAPFVSGTVALIKQANPELTVAQIKTILSATAVDGGPTGKDTRFGWGTIDAYAAVSMALNGNIPDNFSEYDPAQSCAYIISPKKDQSVWGNAVSILTGATNNTARIVFEYQPAGAAGWMRIGEDAKAPFSLYWDVTSLAEGTYQIRSVAFNADASLSNTSAGITVRVDSRNPDITEWGGSEVDPLASHEKQEKIQADRSAEILVADGTTAIIPSQTIHAGTELNIKHILPGEILNKLPPPDASLKPVGIFREFTFTDGTNKFNDDITIFLPYVDDNDDGYVDGTSVHKNNLKIFYLEENEHNEPCAWVEIATDHETSFRSYRNKNESNKGCTGLSFKVDHFTLFAIMSPQSVNNLDNVLVYPNPARTKSVQGITFNNLTTDAQLRIYTLAGRMVRIIDQISDQYTWDMRNAAGEQVQSGVYYYLVTNTQGHTSKGRFAVIQ